MSDPVNPPASSVVPDPSPAAATTTSAAAATAGPARPGGASAGSAVRGLLRQPRFLVAAGLLLVCAVGFNAVAQHMQLFFRKARLELRVAALDDKSAGIPWKVANRWVQVNEDRPMAADLEKTLGTTQYLNRVYVDAVAAHYPPDELHGLSQDRVGRMIGELMRDKPEAIMRLHVAYYSGLVDTVAHIPDRCMVADGFRPTDPEVVTFPDNGADGAAPARSLQYRFITFEDTTAQARVTRNVGYLFHVNGQYTPAPWEVRKRLQELTEKYGYYAKVELMTEQTGKADPGLADKSKKQMQEFLSAVLPEVERCLPDWDVATGRRPAAPSSPAAAAPAVAAR